MQDAGFFLDQAIAMHQMHLDNPASATPQSQNKLMGLLQQAKSALGGTQEPGMGQGMMGPEGAQGMKEMQKVRPVRNVLGLMEG